MVINNHADFFLFLSLKNKSPYFLALEYRLRKQSNDRVIKPFSKGIISIKKKRKDQSFVVVAVVDGRRKKTLACEEEEKKLVYSNTLTYIS